MKNLRISFVLCLLSLIFLGLATMPLISLAVQFAEVIKSNADTWNITVSMMPILPFLILSIAALIVYFSKGKRQRRSFWLWPMVTPADDERERAISAEACRKAFGAVWFAAPLCAILITYYPFFTGKFPIFPVIIVLLIPLVQMTVYFIAVRKIYRS
ncbi:hypothetical protein [Sporolactobacillus putidus]|uniref:DUF2178 domain-containing protein n=1 Tax=Sporolactobacillus putidus TaxID=492735 RepID=A0A917S222_9BACL|nr:hypothetical protein [Sporolactobacillus putidus]GGL52338.1 hypothetical protein GCM10007968_15540 [Sporolactobacillus putidus]